MRENENNSDYKQLCHDVYLCLNNGPKKKRRKSQQ